jgi:hypothetical protein
MESLFFELSISQLLDWTNYREKPGWKWLRVIGGKIRQAIFFLLIKITPGPDRVSFRVLREAYEVIIQIFDALFLALIEAGYHPKCWKEAIGVVLKKPQNPNSSRDY